MTNAIPRASGIYLIANSVNGRVYVGSAVNFQSRWRNHLYRLRKGNHHSKKLQNSWNKHGESAFEFRVVEQVAREDLATREQHWIDTLRPFYNSRPDATTQAGFKQSASTLQKMALAAANISDETRAKLRAAKLGTKASEETKRKMSEARKGKPVHTEASRRRLADLAKGNRNSRGRKHTPEALAKIRAAADARRGVPLSIEHRRKLSESHMKQRPQEAVCM